MHEVVQDLPGSPLLAGTDSHPTLPSKLCTPETRKQYRNYFIKGFVELSVT